MRIASVVLLGCATALARAQPSGQGAKLFEEGRELAKQGKFAEACERFARSHELDPAAGTEANYADCQERLGRLARAWQLFDRVAAASDREGNPVRAQYARERANLLLPRLATLVVNVDDAKLAGLSVTIGGRDYPPAPQIKAYVDPGDVEVIAATATNRITKSIATRAGATAELELPSLAQATEEPRGPRRRGWVLAAGAAGVAGTTAIAASALFALSASRQYADAFAGGQCFHTERGAECTAEGLAVVDRARGRANLATGMFVGGAALVAGAAVIYVIAPRQPYEIIPIAGPRGGGLAIGGRF